MLSVASCYRNRDKLRPDGPLGSKAAFTYHKAKYPFGASICMDSSFQLLLYIMKVKSQKDQ